MTKYNPQLFIVNLFVDMNLPRLFINLDTSFVAALNGSANLNITYQTFEYSTYQNIQIVNLKQHCTIHVFSVHIIHRKNGFSSIFIQIFFIKTIDIYTNPQCFLSFLRHSRRIRPRLYRSSAAWTAFWRLLTAPVRGAPLLMHAAPLAGRGISPSPPLTGEL